MKLGRFITLLAAFLLAAVQHASVNAQGSYPNQTIRLVVPYAPGGLPDTVARIIGQKLTERIGHSVVVENRPGGNGGLAATSLSSAPADGYTFMVTDGSMLSVNPLIFQSLTYDTKKDFTPVALLGRSPLFLASHPSLPMKSLDQFIAYVRANPGKVSYGSSGIGSTHHISMEAMKSALKLDMTHIPYRGSGQSVPALLGGHVQVLFSAYPSLVGAADSKKVNLLATNGPKHSSLAPDVPPIADVIPGFNFEVIVGMLARAGTPPAIVEKISSAVVATVQMPDVAKQYAIVGIEPASAGPAEFQREITSEVERVSKVVRSAGIKIE